MQLTPLQCNECGASLKVGKKTKLVICKRCGTQLAVRREDGGTFTDVVDATKRVEEGAAKLSAEARAMAVQSKQLFLQGELERLDREWELARQDLMLKSKGGHRSVPTRGQAYGLMALAPFMMFPAVLPALTGANFTVPTIFWVFAVLMTGFVLILGLRLRTQAANYQVAVAEYDVARSKLLAKLEKANCAADAVEEANAVAAEESDAEADESETDEAAPAGEDTETA